MRLADDAGALVTSSKRTLKPGATLKPDGVMYERVAVLLLDGEAAERSP